MRRAVALTPRKESCIGQWKMGSRVIKPAGNQARIGTAATQSGGRHAFGGGQMSLPYRQRRRLRRTRRTLHVSEPRLAAMMIMFARLNAGEAMPARERVRRRLPWPVRALARTVRALARAVWAVAHAVWAVLRWCGRAAVSCVRLLRPLGRPLRPCGRLLGRIALLFLIRCSFLPAGFRLTVGCWLVPGPPSARPLRRRRTGETGNGSWRRSGRAATAQNSCIKQWMTGNPARPST